MSNSRIQLNDLFPRLLEVGITFFGHYDIKSAEQKLYVHDHGNNYEIAYLDKGMQPYSIHFDDGSSTTYNLHGGSAFIAHPYEKHSTGAFKQMRGSLYWIQFSADCPNLLGQRYENVELLRRELSSLDNRTIAMPSSVSSRLTEAFMLLSAPNDERFFRACTLLSLFITELANQNRKINDSRYAYETLSAKGLEAISFIENNLLDPDLCVEMIAEHLHYSRSYIMTTFHREIGMTVHEYILHKKIEYARELLKSNTITETSFLLNFSSSQHFSKAFKERTDMTPREYMRSIQK